MSIGMVAIKRCRLREYGGWERRLDQRILLEE